MGLRVLGIVPARGGSKGIPRKNIYPLAGKPLLVYTAEAVAAATRLARTVLSTDSEEIAAVGRAAGLDVPFLRPAELATDTARGIDAAIHVVERVEASDGRYDAVMILQPTSPLRVGADIDAAVGILERTGADSVISVVPVGEHHPARMKYLEGDRLVDPPFAEEIEGKARQDLRPMYLRNGAIYVMRRDVLVVDRSLKGRDCRAYVMGPERSVNIDEPWDLVMAEAALRHGGRA